MKADMDSKDESAFPRENNLYSTGLSKREYFAGLAFQSFINSIQHYGGEKIYSKEGDKEITYDENQQKTIEHYCGLSIRCADELLKQLK